MFELLFVLTTVYAAYLFQLGDARSQPRGGGAGRLESSGPAATAAAPVRAAPPQAAVRQQAAAIPPRPVLAAGVGRAGLAKADASARVVAAARPAVLRPAAATAAGKAAVRNPDTGEVASTATNYRFMKRWVKEALVSEGLLAKVYKNNELDGEAEAAINTALAALRALDRYQP